ncbi:hypothetical protein [Asticcacaulis tiandongensis]|uniref:hypothetical protein n=1 Tax=Asticcacaulis tiandongensis TaxID=2565365 RepID=UPI001126D95B|nr:hypothetical protein [Asticcacaulis tiandongensis]
MRQSVINSFALTGPMGLRKAAGMAMYMPRFLTNAFRSELRFWTIMAVAMAISVQVLFPAHLFAAKVDGSGFMLCNMDAPAVDQPLISAIQAEKAQKGDAIGKKCTDCVFLSMTALPQPDQVFTPVIYVALTPVLTPDRESERPKARAPPRPHSCGPPQLV